jgi:hypothetical protein
MTEKKWKILFHVIVVIILFIGGLLLGRCTKKVKETTKIELVEKRFWAYFNICPHIDNKKIKGPEDLIAFPWEKEGKKENALQYMEKNKNAIDAFFNNVKK